MTRRLLQAFDNPHLHILGHPTGRLLQSREPYPVHMEAVLDRAAERGVTVEVNGKPERLDLKTEHVRMALERGVKLVGAVTRTAPRTWATWPSRWPPRAGAGRAGATCSTPSPPSASWPPCASSAPGEAGAAGPGLARLVGP